MSVRQLIVSPVTVRDNQKMQKNSQCSPMISFSMAIGNMDPAQEENKTLIMVKEEATLDSQDLSRAKYPVLESLVLCKKIWVKYKRTCIQSRTVRKEFQTFSIIS